MRTSEELKPEQVVALYKARLERFHDIRDFEDYRVAQGRPLEPRWSLLRRHASAADYNYLARVGFKDDADRIIGITPDFEPAASEPSQLMNPDQPD